MQKLLILNNLEVRTMASRRYIQHPKTGKLIPAEEYERPGRTLPYIWEDLKAYMPVAGDQAYKKPIEGRKQHREFLKRNGLQEAGDLKHKDFVKYGGKTQENHEAIQRRLKRAKDFLRHTNPRWMDANIK